MERIEEYTPELNFSSHSIDHYATGFILVNDNDVDDNWLRSGHIVADLKGFERYYPYPFYESKEYFNAERTFLLLLGIIGKLNIDSLLRIWRYYKPKLIK